jgi:hypothetical protein
LATIGNDLFAWANGLLWKVDPNTGASAKQGSLNWGGVTAMTSDNARLYLVRNSTLYRYDPSSDSMTQLGVAGAWFGTTRMVYSEKGNSWSLYALKLGKLCEYDEVTNSAVPVGDDTWQGDPPLSGRGNFLYLLEGSNFYKVDKQTGVRTLVASRWLSGPFMAPN